MRCSSWRSAGVGACVIGEQDSTFCHGLSVRGRHLKSEHSVISSNVINFMII